MFTGFTLGLLAAFFWSITNIIDKHLVTKYAPVGNIGGVLLLSCFFPITLAITAFVIARSEIINTPINSLILLLVSGCLMVLWLYFYLKALTEEDASVVMTLLVLAPFFSLIFGFIILGEVLSAAELFSGSLIVCGALLVTYQSSESKINYRLLFYALGASICIAVMQSIFKLYTVEEIFWVSMFWRSVGMVVSGFILFSFIFEFRKDFFTFIKSHLKHGLVLNSSNETLTLIGDTVFAFAILFAPIAIVQSSESYQPIFVILITLVLAKIGIIGLPEPLPLKQRQFRLTGILIVFIGGVLLAVA